jgi:hypothetical protein
MLAIAVVSSVLSSAPLGVEPFCSLDTKELRLHVEITTRWRGEKNESLDGGPHLYELECDVKRRSCVGVELNLTKNPISFLDLRIMKGIELTSVVGRVVILSWGVHQFVFDAAAGTVTKSATQLDGTVERGVGRCTR